MSSCSSQIEDAWSEIDEGTWDPADADDWEEDDWWEDDLLEYEPERMNNEEKEGGQII